MTLRDRAEAPRPRTRRQRRWLAYAVAPMIVLLVAPAIVVIPMSFSASPVLSWPPQGMTLHWYAELFGSRMWRASAMNSLMVALVAAAASVLLGVPAGLALGLKEWRLKRLTLALVVTPLVIPTIVLAIGMYRVYATLHLEGIWGLAAAHAVIGVPFVVITTMSAARQMNPVLLLAARSLGAPPSRAFFHVTLPSIRIGVLSGTVFAFVSSWDKVVIAKFLTTPTFQTIPVQMWSQLTEGVNPTVAALATTLLAVTTLLLVVTFLIARALR